MKKYRRLFFVAATVLLGASCGKVDALQERVDNIENRVEALEKVAATINGNIEALQAIASGQAINNVEEKDGTYVLTLSNGTTLTLQSGSVGMGKAPLMSIDKDGYWMVDYQDGKGASYITDDSGEKIVAVGQNGVTPMFGVSEDGYWTVSYNGGSSYTAVLDPSGNRVKAVAGSSTEDSYFAGVEYKDESLILTLKNGEQYSVPVVGGFLCKITGASDEEVFRKGEKKTFSVEQKGIATTVITAPKGWEAYLTNTVLSIQAPSEVETKAVLADTRTDVAIVAISEAGHIAIAKVKVKVDGSISVYDPAASVALVEAGVSTLKFNVTTENATSWYYVIRKAGEAAPSAAELISGGTKGTEANILVEGLMGQTEYVLYVLPCGDVSNGPIAAFKATTSDYSSMYEAWEAGVEITVGSQTYSKAKNGKGQLVTANGQVIYDAWVNNGNFGAFFIDEGASAVIKNGYKKSLIIIGNKPGTRPTVDFSNQITVEGTETDLVMKNVTLSMDGLANGNPRIYNKTELHRMIFEDCRIDLQAPVIQRFDEGGTNSGKMNGLEIIDCDVCVNWAAATNQYHFVMTQGGKSDCGDLIVKNNVFWSKDGKKEFHIYGSNYSGATKFNKVVLDDNTFYNVNNGLCTKGREHALIMASSLSSFSMSGNIAYDTAPDSKTVATKPHFTWLWTNSMKVEEVKAVTVNAKKNLIDIAEFCAYKGSDTGEWSQGLVNLITWKEGGYSEVDKWENPFASEDTANGVFKTKDTYKDYGAQR